MKTIGRKLTGTALLVLTPLALFYLFVVPALVASSILELNWLTTGFGLFLYAQMWMLTAEYAYESAANLYGFRRKTLFRFLHLFDKDAVIATTRPASRSMTVFLCMLSYALTIYGFAIAYLFISTRDASAFNVGALQLFETIYFSLGTAALAAYGDIVPVSMLARFLSMVEVVIGLIYILFFFSLLSSFLREPSSDSDKA